MTGPLPFVSEELLESCVSAGWLIGDTLAKRVNIYHFNHY